MAASLCLLLPMALSAPAARGNANSLTTTRAGIAMHPDTGYLTNEERKVVNLLIQAADRMSDICLRQNDARNPEMRSAIARSHRADRRGTSGS